MAVFIKLQVNSKEHLIPISCKPLLIGRTNKCNIKLSDPLVSSLHCEIKLSKEGRVVITDLQSTNGTLINEIRIVSAHLYLGDVATIGAVRITIDRSRLSPKEVVSLTNSETMAKTKFIQLHNIKKERSEFKKDLSAAVAEEIPNEVTEKSVVPLKRPTKKKASKARKRPQEEDRTVVGKLLDKLKLGS